MKSGVECFKAIGIDHRRFLLQFWLLWIALVLLFVVVVCSGLFVGCDLGLSSMDTKAALAMDSNEYIPQARRSLWRDFSRTLRVGKFTVAVRALKYWAFGRYRAVKIVDGTLYVSVRIGDDRATVDLLWEDGVAKVVEFK
jgi:hypothetical protein